MDETFKKDKISDLSKLPDISKASLGLIVMTSFIIGLFGKFGILKHILQKFSFSERPINVLILLDETIYLSTMTFTTFNLLIVLLADQTPIKFIETVLQLPINEKVNNMDCFNKNVFLLMPLFSNYSSFSTCASFIFIINLISKCEDVYESKFIYSE